MATLFKNASAQNHGGRYAKRMSSHLATALVVFCLLQIGIVARMGGSLLLHLALIVAIGGFGVAARRLERRWEILDDSGLSSAGLDLRFRRDVAQVWLASIASSLLWIPVAIIFRFLFG
ncbi:MULTISPECIES: hypothetical protein [Sphingobium]|uniref:Uncharacterized protein n=1 Tax=Sphingobium tyrosinilyticum TaxID=2715436 RepID=A0ABV9EW19_9SPHN|nr:hypothetical protein EP837_01659 [Sphingobium sp. EP60837]